MIEDTSFLIPRNTSEYTLGFGFQYNKKIGQGELEIFPKYYEVGDFETDLLNLTAGCVANTNTEDVSTTISYYWVTVE